MGCSGHGTSSAECDGSTCADGGDAATHHDSGKDAGGHPDSRADAASADLEPLDPTVATNLAYSSAFLYTGPNAVQTGVAAGTIDITRVSVIRGQVQVHSTVSGATDGLAPSPGVAVAVLGHPEFGATKTQSDGWFSLAVNGGGSITLTFQASGYLPVQRRVTTEWLEYSIANPLDAHARAQASRSSSPRRRPPYQVAPSPGSLVCPASVARERCWHARCRDLAAFRPGAGHQEALRRGRRSATAAPHALAAVSAETLAKVDTEVTLER